MSLLVSLKNELSTKVAQAFRQVELWANGYEFQPLQLSPPWSPFGGSWCTPGYVITPFGQVVFQGVLQYTGTLAANSVTVIIMLPAAINPKSAHQYPAGTVVPALIQVGAGPNDLRVVQGATASGVNPSVSLDSVSYYPWQV